MYNKLSFKLILFIIISVNALGYFLRYFEFDTYFILLGFRFHISLFLPLIFILKKELRTKIKKIFSDPGYKGKFLPLLWILIPILVISASPFITNIIKEGDPEYFYEFGLSSLFDYPVYLLWNFPQLALFYIFLLSACFGRKNKFLLSLSLTSSLFLFEFLPLRLNAGPLLNYSDLSALFLSAIISSILCSFFENIYWFSISVFSLLWSFFLAFGTKAAPIINIFFASRYKSWEGFLACDKDIKNYLIIIYLLLPVFFLLIALPFRRNIQSELKLSETENISQIPGMG